MISVQIGPAQLPELPRKMREEFKKRQLQALHAIGKQAVRLLHFQSASIKDLGSYQTGWRYQAAFNRLYLRNVSAHAKYVEEGRRPGRPPPVRALMGWAQRKLGDARLAYPVARAIGRRGIRPRPVLTRPDVQKGLRSVWEAGTKALLERVTNEARPK